MSNRYKGGIISATPPTTTGGETGVASGAWTLEQQLQAQAAGNWPIQPPPVYIEDVFSTWLYTGNWAGTGSTNTVTVAPGIAMSTKGGMALFKNRSSALSWAVFDTARGNNSYLATDTSDAAQNFNTWNFGRESMEFTTTGVTATHTNVAAGDGFINYNSTKNFVVNLFREQPKFFDVVTWTGNGVSNRAIAHSLGSVPGCIIVKRLTAGTTGDWCVWHRSLNYGEAIFLNRTDAAVGDFFFGTSTPTSTQFFLSTNQQTNASGDTYVAYLFAHNAGGFGPTETDNVISCGSFSAPSGNATVTLGYEPQYILWKRTDAAQNWNVYDTMRGWAQTQQAQLYPNLTQAEDMYTGSPYFFPTATGFQLNSSFGLVGDYIYIAIRRGPMKVPTTGTSVFDAQLTAAAPVTLTGLSAPDAIITRIRESSNATWNSAFVDRLRGDDRRLVSSSTAAEAVTSSTVSFTSSQNATVSITTGPMVDYSFKRAPGFFDEVCYTGTGSATTFAHNLGVAPELMIVKRRNTAGNGWATYCAPLGNTAFLYVNSTGAADSGFNQWNNTSPTTTQFSVSTSSDVNASGGTYVAYLFASCPGVSKVGSYTGTGTTQTINCGFTGGARFVFIKRTDSTGDWYVWDTARGMIPANDPYLLLNSTAAEVTGTDFVDTAATGFEISSTAPAAINANGGTFIFLAIA